MIVPDRGGYLASLILPFASGTRETLFLHNTAWDAEIDDLVGGIPFLFPICGRVAHNNKIDTYCHDGKLYSLKIHGFSWYAQWEVSDQQPDCVTLTLQDTTETLARYPFPFKIQLQWRVTPGQLTCHQVYENRDTTKIMPFYAGFHPYFLTPPANAGKENVLLTADFKKRLHYNVDLTAIIGESAPMQTPIAITTPEINEQLCVFGENQSATLTFPNGDVLKTAVQCDSDPALFSYLQLYTIPDHSFFCIEPWMRFPNALNTVAGSCYLQPGETIEADYLISC